MVFARQRLAVFVDGCFWHACPIHATKPRTNEAFWSAKLESNVRRDREVNRLLAEQGWEVLRVWQHELRGEIEPVVGRIVDALDSSVSN